MNELTIGQKHQNIDNPNKPTKLCANQHLFMKNIFHQAPKVQIDKRNAN